MSYRLVSYNPSITSSVTKLLVEISQSDSVSHCVLLNTLHSLGTSVRRDRNGLDNGEQLLLSSKLQHSQTLRSRSNVRGTNGRAVGHELLCHDVDSLVGQTDLVELAVDLQDGEVVVELELVGHVGGVEDEVEGECEGLGPVFLGGGDEVFGAELEGVVLLVGGV